MKHPRKRRKVQPVCETFDWHAECCSSGHIHLTIMKPGEPPFEVSFIPEDGYEFAHDVLKKYDEVNGI